MRIGVVSDTHGHTAHTLNAVRMLEELDVEAVLHCGDIGTPDIPPLFRRWPTHYVFGNCDGNWAGLRAAIEASGGVCHEREASLLLGGRKIGLIHSDDHYAFVELIRNGRCDLVCYGHTHIAKQEQSGTTLVLNPGALYRANPHRFAVVDLATLEVTSFTI